MLTYYEKIIAELYHNELFIYYLTYLVNFSLNVDDSDCTENKLCLISWKDFWKNKGNGRGGLGKDILFLLF